MISPYKYLPWFGSVRQWHWVSSALCLVGMLLFAITGITLNHAGQIEAKPETRSVTQTVPADALEPARAHVANEGFAEETELPPALKRWLAEQADVHVGERLAQWSEYDLYVSMPRPGGDAWLSVDLESGELVYDSTHRGSIAYLNDLHKGRNTGTVWMWFIDAFSVACIVFCITGLILLHRHSKARPSTWPLVGLGLVIPVLLALLFIHA